MAIVGRKPKPEDQRRNPVAPRYDWTDVVDAPYEGAKPALPPRRGRWPTATKQWWERISRMPHCILWTETDWQFALDTALVHAAFVGGNDRGARTELRHREKRMGTTFETLRDLRIRYVEALPVEVSEEGDGAEGPRPVSFEQRRRELQA